MSKFIYPQDLIETGDGILGGLTNIDERLYNRIVKYLAQHTENGKVKLSTHDMAELEDIIYKDVKGTPGYESKVKNYLELFDKLEASISEEQVILNGLRVKAITDLWRRSGIREMLREKVIYDLSRNGIKQVFVRGVADAVREQAFFSRDIETAMNILRKKLIDDKYTERYLRQTVMDSLSQYDGAMQDQIRIAYDFDELLYATNTIETSRPLCKHIRDTLGGRISREQLQTALDEYCPDGIPSDVYTTGKRRVTDKEGNVTFETVKMKKGSGMIVGTVVDNFAQLKGGYACRHRPLWTRSKNKISPSTATKLRLDLPPSSLSPAA